jgi:hypothetical protein
MNDSLSQWLALREAADWSARSERLVQSVRDALPPADAVRGLDLCAGTGSNFRYLLDRLPGPQRWLAVDRDPALLDEVPVRLSAWAKAKGGNVTTDGRVSHVRGDRVDVQVDTRELNLERLDAALFEGRNLVTASALLDLVSESWLRMLAARCRVEPLFRIAAGAFTPPPRVESAYVRITPWRAPPFEVADTATFAHVVTRAFSQRRKTLRNALAGLVTAESMSAIGIDPGARPETLSPAQFAALARSVRRGSGILA